MLLTLYGSLDTNNVTFKILANNKRISKETSVTLLFNISDIVKFDC
jgi:hypothetical protein